MSDIIAMKTIIFTHRAAKDLDALPPDVRYLLTEALSTYAVLGEGDVKKLSGRDGYRRIGRYRVIFDEDRTTILAIYFGKREATTDSRNRE